jgi:hypothetical protein
MGNFLSSILGTIADGGKLSWNQVLILGLVPLGQLYARVNIFNGSLDKWWLMFPLLLFPPLSFIPLIMMIFPPLRIIPLIMMKFGLVKNGTGSKPVDNFMLIPIIAKLIIPFILPFIINEDSSLLFTIVSFVLQLITVMTANLIRRKDNCKEITTNSVGKAGVDSIIAIAAGEITSFAIGFVPLIGMFISMLKNLPVIGGIVDSLVWSVGFAGAYVLINMFNQDPNINKLCSSPFTGNIQDRIPLIGSLAVILFVSAKKILL